MSDDKTNLFHQYQNICLKLRKKRLLKKPNLSEACQQFEQLGICFERENLPHYAGLCYQAAAKCQHSLLNGCEESYLLLKSGRQFMSSYTKNLTDKSIPNESYLYHSYMYYKECITRLKESKECSKHIINAITGSVILELGDNLITKAGFVEEGCCEYETALELFDSPVEKIHCMQKIISSKIKLGDYSESLKLVNEVIDLAKSLPQTGLKKDILLNSEITKMFLVLIIQPAPQQISCATASTLEKYAWVDTLNGGEIKDLQATLKNENLSMFSEDLFLLLQSLVMACQYCDIESLKPLECDLIPYLNNEQKDLLRILLKQYTN